MSGSAVTSRKIVTGLAVVLAAGTLVGCSAAEPEAPESPEAKAPVVQPGAPGDEPRVVDEAELREQESSERSVEAEAEYVRMMIPHHQQAIEMTEMAPDRVENAQVRALAERIGGAQGPEIEAMRGWLSSHGLAEHTGHGDDHSNMAGMASPEELARLEASSGAEFDRLFLRLMTTHHEGAVTMATDVMTEGTDEQVHGMAQDVIASQTDEIVTMQRMLADMAP
ncbi:DUF305 domain-containing protein [Parasphingorhabdus pacifica]